MRKPGDIEMIFADPGKSECPVGQAKLVIKVKDIDDKFERWYIEYLDNPDHQYLALLKKTDNGNTN